MQNPSPILWPLMTPSPLLEIFTANFMTSWSYWRLTLGVTAKPQSMSFWETMWTAETSLFKFFCWFSPWRSLGPSRWSCSGETTNVDNLPLSSTLGLNVHFVSFRPQQIWPIGLRSDHGDVRPDPSRLSHQQEVFMLAWRHFLWT